MAISQHDRIAIFHDRKGFRKNQSTRTKIKSSEPGGNQMTQQNSNEAQDNTEKEQESQPDSDPTDNQDGIHDDNPDGQDYRWEDNEHDEGRRLITVPMLGTALAVVAVIAAGAIGYIVGTSGEQTPTAAPPPVVRTIQQAPTQQFQYPDAEQVAPPNTSRPAAYDFSATTMEGEN